MADKRDYYEVLGITKTSTEDEIKKAYRNMAKKYHPDLNPDDKTAEEKFKEVNEAYEVLSDQSKKSRYDQFGHAGVDPSYGGGGYAGGTAGGFGGFSDMSDILEGIFGSFGGFGGSAKRSNPNAPRRGRDIQKNITIDFMEACKGCAKEVNVESMETCDSCDGKGTSSGKSPDICPECHGSGSVNATQRTPFGVISSPRTCTRCSGSGKIINDPCPKCRGNGRIRKTKTVSVNIPAGIDNGQTLQSSGEGDRGINGGPAGDLLLNITIRPDLIFEREGFDIHCEIPITYMQATLGDEITVPTIDGKVKYDIAEGTQTGTVFRLKGKGIKKLNRSDRGDQFVHVYIEVPKNLSKKQKEALNDFEHTLNEKNYQKRQNFFDKLKEKFQQ